ncbi:CHAT domain-containing protein [Tabrizicola fusiformis]|uniref:CHAT domain-containing protein n=1 Tax=Tabrizicola sp. SY72 TaxID=2741673 RepID=UPI001574E8EE|nr:CHAT domain-containing protein [Tabrizicola sp. SY72]NTT85882.1 CHAT domain-containing protein [Tabrizicola sp. SY72]
MSRFFAVLALVLTLATSAPAEEALTPAEVDEVAGLIEATLVVGGDYAQAEASAQQFYGLVLQDFGEESRQAVQIEFLLVLAAAAQDQQDRAEALGYQLMQKAQRVLKPDDPLLYRCAAAYAVGLRSTGRGGEALGLATEALALADGALPPGDLAVAELRLLQAQLATEAGQGDLAAAIYDQLADSLRDRDDPQTRNLRAMGMIGWAGLVNDIQGPEAAIPLLQAAIAALDANFATLPRPSLQPLRLTTEGQLIEALHLTGQDKAALAILEARLPEITAHYGQDSPFWADMAFLQAVILAGDDPASPGAARALVLMRQVVAVREATLSPDTIDLLRARVNLAMLLASTGQGAEALAQIHALGGAALPGGRMQLTYILRLAEESGALTREAAVEAMLGWLQESQDSGAAAAQILLTQRLAAGSGRGADLLRARTDTRARLEALQGELAALTTLPVDQRDPAAIATLRDAIRSQMESAAEIRTALETELPALAEATGRRALTLAEIRAGLGPEGALVLLDVPQDPDDPGLIIAVSREAVDWHTLPAPGPEIAAAIVALRAGIDLRLGVRGATALDDAAPVATGFDLDRAHWLYRQLLAPVSGVIADKTQLFFDLRGPVSALPPQLLLASAPQSGDMAAADWLVRHHAVTILPAISALQHSGAAGPAAGEGLLAFADPQFGAMPAQTQLALRGGLAPLPETEGEVRAVAAALHAPEGSLHLGAGASEAALKSAALGDVGLLYFATHGLVSGDSVGQAALAEPALALTPGGGEDGFLTASEIAELHLNARFVVLSACNTAAGGAPGGEALSGLAQSFLYAGARGLLVSHWPVESRSAVALMTDLFHRRAAAPGLSAADAQRQAILAMIDHPSDPRWSHPAYWAPFVLVGQPD